MTIFYLVHDEARRRAAQACQDSPYGTIVRFGPASKSREQEAHYHALIAEIADTFVHGGRKWDEESMKRLLVDQFRRDTAKDPELAPLWEAMGTVEIAPSLDGSGVVALGWQTRRFPKALASAFIEWLMAFQAEIQT